MTNPCSDGTSGLIGDLKLNGSMGFSLHDDSSGSDLVRLPHITYSQCDEVASSKFAIDREIEECEVAEPAR